VLPAALPGSASFDVSQVDLATVQLSRADGVGGSVAPHEGPPGPHTVVEDVATPFDGDLCDCHEETGDGLADLSMKFLTELVTSELLLDDLPAGALVELTLTGTTLDGTEFHANDCIRLVPPGTVPGPFPSFCDGGDRSLASCPCVNMGDPDTGCDIAQATGGVHLGVVAQETSPQNRATLMGSGYPSLAAPGSVVIRAHVLDSAAPVVLGDGLRCVGTPLVRLAGTLASGGISTHIVGHGSGPGSGTFYYQIWFRNQPAMFCTPDAFNLSNGRTICW
jgi:hypothetical protein